jgi:putative endonuclease
VRDRRLRLGQFGERLAADHLESKGYQIVARNYRTSDGEVDIIAQRDACLVFVEVRTRRGDSMGSAVESLTRLKGARIHAVAEAYCEANPDCPEERRIDVITVDLTSQGRFLRLEHIESAFSLDELPELTRH